MKKLTDSYIKGLKAKDTRYRVKDTQQGLYVCVLPSGTKAWQVQVKEGGKWTFKGVGVYDESNDRHLSLADARKAAYELRNKERVQAKTGMTFRAAYELSIKTTGREETLKTYDSHFNNYLAGPLGDMPLASITKDQVKRLIDGLDKGPATKHMVYAVAQKVFAHAYHADEIDVNVLAGVSAKRLFNGDATVPKREKILPVDHIGDCLKVWSDFGYVRGSWITFLLASGLRKKNANNLRWENIVRSENYIRYESDDMKGKKPFKLPISPLMAECLETARREQGQDATGLIFPNSVGGPFGAYQSVCRATAKRIPELWERRPSGRDKGLACFSVHDFRSNIGEWMEDNGDYSPQDIHIVLSHGVDGLLRNYVREPQFVKRKREILDRWSDYLMERRAAQ